MAQHDYTIANQSAPNARADINNALAAIVSQNSGTTAPGTTYANQIWYDTSNNILKMRNEADNAWIAIATLDQSAGTSSAAITFASQAEAEGGANSTKSMTPLLVKQAIDFNKIIAWLAVGTYSMLLNNTTSAIAGGASIAGSSLRYGIPGGALGKTQGGSTLAGNPAPGTWRLMGNGCLGRVTNLNSDGGIVSYTFSAALFLRIS